MEPTYTSARLGFSACGLDPQTQFANIIVKPGKNDDRLRRSAVDEFFCMTLARNCGLNVPKVFLLERKDGGYNFAIERFGISPCTDSQSGSNNAGRKAAIIDVAVLFGKAFMENKYRSSTPELFGTMQSILSPKDMYEFARAYLFGFLIGNGDMRLRNFSLFVEYDDISDSLNFTPTPFYDMIRAKCYERYKNNDLGLGLYATGVGGAVTEAEFVDFMLDYLPPTEIRDMAELVLSEAGSVRNGVSRLTKHDEEPDCFARNIYRIIEKKTMGTLRALNSIEYKSDVVRDETDGEREI